MPALSQPYTRGLAIYFARPFGAESVNTDVYDCTKSTPSQHRSCRGVLTTMFIDFEAPKHV